MEPFGLFQILQSFLGTNANATGSEEEMPPPANAEPTKEKAPETPPTAPEEERECASNAFLSFVDAHDKRARRIKKP
ncbi:MAG: hypothetical protein IJX96_05310 [Clostridia bacterium]|nr:hypothetical protein [Clostridia bacterium]